MTQGANGAYSLAMNIRLQTVVETPAYLAAAKGVLSDADRVNVVNTVAENPEAGVSLGGGIRKMRVSHSGRGKRSGARVVFLFSGEDIPVFLLTVFPKSKKANLSVRERALLIDAAKRIVENYRRQK